MLIQRSQNPFLAEVQLRGFASKLLSDGADKQMIKKWMRWVVCISKRLIGLECYIDLSPKPGPETATSLSIAKTH